MLASMRLCSNVPGQFAIQTALGGYQSINDLVAPGGRLRASATSLGTAHADSRRQLRQAQGLALPVPAPRPEDLPRSRTTSASSLELLEEERVLLVQGTGFNWPRPDHFRVVFLPHEDDLREAIGRIARFLDGYRKRHGT
jgi:alanine-synthesizing transaminase